MMGDYLDADSILAAGLATDDVDVPEWGGTVKVREMTGTERDRFEFKMALARKDPENLRIRAEVVGRCIIDADGERLFTDKQIGALGDKSARALDRVFDKVRDLSGLTDEASDEAVEDFVDAPEDSSPGG